ncbi:PilZ domain-containing protein [Geodermatophilus sp. URMC 61]|uniref:PilZ domain-containing protein n=1 Tax=Geodermatophilus sp. URMC 61 TaxID=3423411 RepID=UPI00406CB41E
MATGIPGVDYPEAKEPVDVQSASRGDALTSFVEESGNGPLTLTVPADRSGRRVRLDIGEYVQLVWKGPEGLRALPAELTEVLPGEEPRWRVRPMGPATRGQRRNAVRAPMSLPVEAVSGRTQLIGESIDVSEGGLHCLFQPDGGTSTREHHATAETTGAAGDDAAGKGGAEAAPAGGSGRVELSSGTQLEVTLSLGGQEQPVRSKAEVVRVHPRTDRRIEVSLRFLGLPEREEDRIRARVFTELRVLRSRGLL